MPDVRMADVEALLITYLSAHLPVPVVTLQPKVRPPSFVRVWRTGGSATSRAVDRPQVTVQAWAADTVTAYDLVARCRLLLLNAARTDGIRLARGSEEASGPYFDPDPDTGIPRYSFTARLTVRATATTQEE